MTAVYENKGLSFQYPENWKLTDIEDHTLPYQFALETPDGAQWSVNVFPESHSPDQIVADAIEALSSQYEDAEFSKANVQIVDQQFDATDAHFYCLDFVVRAQVFTAPVDKYNLLFWYQAESRDFDKQLPVFHAITHSLLNSTMAK